MNGLQAENQQLHDEVAVLNSRVTQLTNENKKAYELLEETKALLLEMKEAFSLMDGEPRPTVELVK